MDQKDIHYRTGGRLTHCGCEMLPNGEDIPRIIIERIEYKESEMINGRRELGVWIAHFAPNNGYTNLPFIMNATNRKRLVKLFPQCDGYLARLENIPVRMTREKTRDVQDGGETWGLRISKIPADNAPVQEKIKCGEDMIDTVVAWAKQNHKTIEELCEIYEMAETVKDAIIDALNG